jgi:cytochrome c556
VRTDASGRKWYGNIPYDIWFNEPLTVAAENTAVAAANVPTTTPDVKPSAGEQPLAAPTPAGSDTPASTAATGAADWKALAPISVLEAETKKIRNHLTESLKSVGQYNANYKDIQADGATLAAIAAIVLEHPDPISWKENAAHIRDLGAKIAQEAQGLGKKPFDATQIPFEQLIVILDGSKPQGLEAAESTVDFAERADRGGLMKRMEKSFEWMKKNVTTESVFKSEKETLLHESAVLAALASVIATEGYTSADEDEYKGFAKGLIDASRGITQDVQSENFTGFTNNINQVQKKCDECHVEYRNG